MMENQDPMSDLTCNEHEWTNHGLPRHQKDRPCDDMTRGRCPHTW